MEEIWKTITEFENYEVSNLGRIRNSKKKILNQYKNTKGYLQLTLYKNKKQYTKRVHRLVAQAFIPNPNNLPQINHKSGIKTDNNINNLEWCTNSYNQLEANRMGFCKNRIKKSTEATRKPISQYDLDGNYIATYISLRDATNKTNGSYKSISQCACGKTKSSSGFIWKYEVK